MSKYYMGGENQTTIQKLLAGETVIVKGKGNSMTPKLKSGEAVIVEPITPDTIIRKRDIVLCKVKGHIYLHLVTGISGIVTKYLTITDTITVGLSKFMVNMSEKPRPTN